MAKLACAVAGILFLLGLAGSGLQPSAARAQRQEKPQRWEYKAVLFSGLEVDAHTKQLNDLAGEGWEYVGPLNTKADARLSTTSVAFRRVKK